MFVPDNPTSYKVYEQKNAIYKDDSLGHYFIDAKKYEELKGFAVSPKDIIVSCAGTIGETYVLPENIRTGIINQALMIIRLYDISIIDFYLLYFDFILKNEATNESKGTAIKNIPPFDILKNFLIPIPPLAEQIRIIEETNKWLVIVQQIEENGNDVSNLVTKIKSKILDLAIRGKLIPQDPNDEPAIELLRRINPDFQPCDNAHYKNLPESWTTMQVSQISKLLSGRDIPNNLCNGIGKGIPYLIGASNIEDNDLEITRWTEMPQVTAEKNDVLISCKGTIGKIIKNEIGRVHIARQFMAIRPNADCIDPDYLLLCIFAIVEEIKKDARGVVPGISRDDILFKQIPIPPINEQQRIYNAIKQYNKILDNIITEL